jgi:hypothetical protein
LGRRCRRIRRGCAPAPLALLSALRHSSPLGNYPGKA